MKFSGSIADVLRPGAAAPALRDGVPVFLSSATEAMASAERMAKGENLWKNFFKRWPVLYDFLVFLIAPCFFTGLTPKKFIRRFVPAGIVLNAGSGVKRLSPRCINVDLFPFSGVDVVSDLKALPFRSDVFDAVTCDQVLEHVEDPQVICAELLRTVKPGGLVHVASPFVFPWHPSPSDYTRWTQEGLASLFPGCIVVEQGVLAGPFSALNGFLPAFLATILCFGSKTLQGILQYLFLVLLFPIKFFDCVFARMPGAELCSANFYVVVRKREVL